MNGRRNFILGSAAALLPGVAAQQSRYSHRLPASDQNYARSRSYIEDTPIPEYRWASDATYESFKDLKYGVRIHWGIYTLVHARRTSWSFLEMPYPERDRYNELYRTWNPNAFDAGAWMDLFRESGMRMFAFTSKHHEGFSLFDTKTRVRRRVRWAASGGPRIEECDLSYSVMETPSRRDIVKELCDAARPRGLKVDLYFSHTDFYDADFRPYGYHPLQVPSAPQLTNAQAPQDDPTELERARGRMKDLLWMAPDPAPEETRRMIARHRAQLRELLTNYGPIDMLCLDIWLGRTVWPEMRKTLLEIRRLQPEVMLRARGIGNYGDYYTPEGFVPGAPDASDVPWFVIYALGPNWSYEADASRYKPASWIVHNLIDSVAKGGNFMVGIGPDSSGQFHPAAVTRLREAGAWLKVNGEAIYGTRERTDWRESDNVRLNRTKDGRTTFAHCLTWPGRTLNLRTVRPAPGRPIHMLGYPEALRARYDAASGLTVDIPESLQQESNRPCAMAWVFRIPTLGA